MRDAIDLEAMGIPSVCLVHIALVPAVQALARLVGVPENPIVVVDYPHNPTAMWEKDEAAAIGLQVVEGVYNSLTARH